METTLVLLGGSSGVSSNESKVEALDVGLSSEATSGAELELGLALGLSIAGANDRGRIFTAKDFPCPISGTKRAADSAPQEAASLSPPRSSQVVGWPPIRSYRMNSLVNQAKTPRAEEGKALDRKGNSKDLLKNENKTSLKVNGYVGFIKVNTDGMSIGRKVDLSVHACYETLAQALEDMFFKPTTNVTPISELGSIWPQHALILLWKNSRIRWRKGACNKLLDGSSEFVLTYEDKDGDWMLVGDVPWRMFVNNVKRLRIMRTSEAKGLAPRVQDTNERQKRTPV